MTYLYGFTRARQDQIRRDAESRVIVERVVRPGLEQRPHGLRLVLGRTLVSAGLHLMGGSARLRDAA
jgi:hypothetical protein